MRHQRGDPGPTNDLEDLAEALFDDVRVGDLEHRPHSAAMSDRPDPMPRLPEHAEDFGQEVPLRRRSALSQPRNLYEETLPILIN